MTVLTVLEASLCRRALQLVGTAVALAAGEQHASRGHAVQPHCFETFSQTYKTGLSQSPKPAVPPPPLSYPSMLASR
jgi:hypothetical protein